MTESGLYEDDLERQQHAHAIQTLAKRVRVSEEEVYRVYEVVLREYKSKAKIKTYLPILVAKRVEELLDKTRALS